MTTSTTNIPDRKVQTQMNTTKQSAGDRASIFMSRVVPTCMTIQTAILLAGIPWALSIHGRLITLEVVMKGMVPAARLATDDDVDALRERVGIIEHTLKLKGYGS